VLINSFLQKLRRIVAQKFAYLHLVWMMLFYLSRTENKLLPWHLCTWATYYIKPMRRNAYTRNGCVNGVAVIMRHI
jgi:hypothetical protein